MAHLGSDVAAFVDGQLTPAAMHDADAHLQRCDACHRAVRQQRLLKSRMGTVSSPELPSGLFAALAGLASEPPPPDGWWTRMRRGAPMRVGMVLVGASMTVAAVAYAVGGGSPAVGDRITPPFDEYAAAFFGAAARVTPASLVSDDTVDELTRDGWPCHPRLAGDLERTQAVYAQADDTIALTYTNGTARMKLYEQTGWLDPAALDGFTRRDLGPSSVWVRVRGGDPTVITWDEGGVVFTIVTDADPERIRGAIAELPASDAPASPITRVGQGLDRMSAWVSAA